VDDFPAEEALPFRLSIAVMGLLSLIKQLKYMTNITLLNYKGKFVEQTRYDTMT
jgi:hypothetical protein